MGNLSVRQRELYKDQRGITITDNTRCMCKNCFYYTRNGICSVHFLKTQKCNTCIRYKK